MNFIYLVLIVQKIIGNFFSIVFDTSDHEIKFKKREILYILVIIYS